jgi:serine/threonine protein kinase
MHIVAGKDEGALAHAICTAPPRLPPGAGALCTELLQRMLAKNPQQRISIVGVGGHAWLRG